MSDSFYRAFEDRYRGSRDLIKDRLTAYRPFVSPLLDIYHPAAAIDLGCGRGEWLELLSAWGFTAKGVDLDIGMLSAAQEQGFEVAHGDAIAYLTGQASESMAIVSAFHLVEHLPFDDLRKLIGEAFRVLKPGGLLIMETPNPENIVVATRTFYLDPTHEKPIPSDLLAFTAKHSGFERVRTVRLQESKTLREKTAITLLDAIGGASPDYAIVAQKEAPTEILSRFDEAFSREYGLSQETLLSRFDANLHTLLGTAEATAQQAKAKAHQAEETAQQAKAKAHQAEETAQQAEAKAQHAEETAQQAEAKAQHAEAKAQHAEAKAQHAEAKAQHAEAKAQHAEAKAHQAEETAQQAEAKAQHAEETAQQAEAKAQHAEAKAQHAEAKAQHAEAKAQHAEAASNQALTQLHAVYASTSWRITTPLRWVGTQLRLLNQNGAKSRLRAVARKGLQQLIAFLRQHPTLKRYAIATAYRLGVADRIRKTYQSPPLNATTHAEDAGTATGWHNLTPKTRRIYTKLKKAIAANNSQN
ncbi:MAG: methyltransferase domain-containing protein [Propionivibrio sp.]|nr:methyltransferase domain-containing protein [Propionivibrio sp.]